MQSLPETQGASLSTADTVLRVNCFERRCKQYEWFVSSILYACETVLAVFSKRKGWMHGITAQLHYSS